MCLTRDEDTAAMSRSYELYFLFDLYLIRKKLYKFPHYFRNMLCSFSGIFTGRPLVYRV